jgi:predicted chitinase
MDFQETDFTNLVSELEQQQNNVFLFHGSSGNDSILGSDNGETLRGFAGDDTIHALSGNDWLSGDAQNDWMNGNAGQDTVYGDAGNDTLYGGKNEDILLGNAGRDWLSGNRESDTIRGGEDDDLIYGGKGNDLISGDPGEDTLFGDKGSNTLQGGDGSDLFVLNPLIEGSTSVETDWITDFKVGEDLIDFTDNLDPSSLILEQTDLGNVAIRMKVTKQTIAIVQGVDTDVFNKSSFVDETVLSQEVEDLTTPPSEDSDIPVYPGYSLQYESGDRLSYDPNVEFWQQRMQDLGFEIEVDGFYGLQSETVARQFQQAVDLEVNGVVSRDTWEAAFTVDSVDIPSDNGGSYVDDTDEIIYSFAVDYSIRPYAEDSIPIILRKAEEFGITDPAQIAYILATADHESLLGKYMEEIASGEAYEWREDLGNTQPGDGPRFKGRGYVQITGRINYLDWSDRLNLDLINDPDQVKDPEIAATILVQGMLEGTFTGRKLSDYINSNALDFINARRIINGTDRAQKIAEDANRYYEILIS